jgi:hypothetical protein
MDRRLPVTDISSNDAYAIGECVSHASQIMEQWNGAAWSTVTLPDPDPSDPGLQQQLYGVSADSASDVWAVGTHLVLTSTGDTFVPWSVHWNGSAWSVVSSPDKGAESMFVGAATTPGGVVNAVGWTSPSAGAYNTLAADTTG